MKTNRRTFLSTVGSVGFFPFISFSEKMSFENPIASLQPTDNRFHSITYNDELNAYEIQFLWKPYESFAMTQEEVVLPKSIIKSTTGDVIRDPISVYNNSLSNPIQKQISVLENQFKFLSILNLKKLIEEAEDQERVTMKPKTEDFQQDSKQDYDWRETIRDTKNDGGSEESQKKQAIESTIEQPSKNRKNDTIDTNSDWFGSSVDKPVDEKPPILTISSNKSHIEDASSSDSSLGSSDVESDATIPTKLVYGFQSDDWKNFLVPHTVRFVQQLQYIEDYKRQLPYDYPQYPSETLYLGIGDCEDSSILLATLLENLQALDVRTGLTSPPGHMAVIAAIPDLPNSNKYEVYTTIDGVEYTYFETTTPSKIYGQPDTADEEPSFIYVDGEFKEVNLSILPASVREAVKIGKNGILSTLL